MHFEIAAIVSAESRENALDKAEQIFSQMCGDIYDGARYEYFYTHQTYQEAKWLCIEYGRPSVPDVLRIDGEVGKKKARNWLDYVLNAISQGYNTIRLYYGPYESVDSHEQLETFLKNNCAVPVFGRPP